MYAIKDPSYLQNIDLKPETLIDKSVCWWRLINELIIKEFGACLKHIWYRCRYTFNPAASPLNPARAEKASHPGQIAKVLVLLHGSGGHGSCFIPLANSLKNTGFENIYTVNLIQTKEHPVPIENLESTIHHLRREYLKKGYSEVEFALVGHSLGALVAAKYVWRKWNPSTGPAISFIVSLGGRLKYLKSPFSWFCADVRPDIDKTYEGIFAAPHKTRLYSLWGGKDALVPRKSSHLFGNKKRELTLEDYGHNGIVFSVEAHHKILGWVREWTLQS